MKIVILVSLLALILPSKCKVASSFNDESNEINVIPDSDIRPPPRPNQFRPQEIERNEVKLPDPTSLVFNSINEVGNMIRKRWQKLIESVWQWIGTGIRMALKGVGIDIDKRLEESRNSR